MEKRGAFLPLGRLWVVVLVAALATLGLSGAVLAAGPVSTEAELVAAVQAAAEGDVIEIAGDIELKNVLQLSKSLTFRASEGVEEATLTTSMKAGRHIIITGRVIELVFENIVLDGQGISGGIRSEADHLVLDAVIRNCVSHDKYNSTNYIVGGGVYAKNKLTINGGEISGNCAERGGGAYAFSLLIKSGNIENNSAQNLGGGVFGSSTSILGGTIYQNTAAVSGGGVYGSSIEIQGGEICGNQATITGAGVASSSSVTVTGGSIFENNVAKQGGGIASRSVTITGGEITGNTAKYGGGISLIGLPLSNLQIRNRAVVADNTSAQPYYITDPDDIALHGRNIDPTVTWSQGFDYIYNNNDVEYLKGDTEPPAREGHTVTVITRYLDDALPEHTETYLVPHGAAFCEPFQVLEGYKLVSAGLRAMPLFNVDMETSTVSIDPVEQDLTVTLEFDRSAHSVTVITRYEDGAFPDTEDHYLAAVGQPFEAGFEVQEGYTIKSVNFDALGVTVREAARLVTIDSVNSDITVIITFWK